MVLEGRLITVVAWLTQRTIALHIEQGRGLCDSHQGLSTPTALLYPPVLAWSLLPGRADGGCGDGGCPGTAASIRAAWPLSRRYDIFSGGIRLRPA